MQQFLFHSFRNENGTVDAYRPMLASPYAAIYIVTPDIVAPPPIVEGEAPPLPVPPQRYAILEYTIPRQVTRKEPLRAFRKHKVMPSDLIHNADGTQSLQPKDIWVLEQMVTALETMTAPISDPESVAKIEAYLKANLAF